MRAQFRSDPIAPAVLARLLAAAHAAPSVGFMQPWDFLLIDDPALRHAIEQMFARENQRAVANYEGERATLYRSLKLEGILESPLNLCITCDRTRGGPHVLGSRPDRRRQIDAVIDYFGESCEAGAPPGDSLVTIDAGGVIEAPGTSARGVVRG